MLGQLRRLLAAIGRRGGHDIPEEGGSGGGGGAGARAGAAAGLAASERAAEGGAAAGVGPRRQTGYVIGFRNWLVVLDDDGRPALASCVLPCIWQRRKLVAHHLRDDGTGVDEHPAPRRRCECGIYAVHDTTSRWLDRLGGPDTIAGAVRLSGMVRRHREEGVRAQVAEIVALARPSGILWAHQRLPLNRHRLSLGERSLPTEQVDPVDLATRYGVPLVDPRHLTIVALEHGSTLWP